METDPMQAIVGIGQQLAGLTRQDHAEADRLLRLLAKRCLSSADEQDALEIQEQQVRATSHREADALLLRTVLALPVLPTSLEQALLAWYATLCRDVRLDDKRASAANDILHTLSKAQPADWPYDLDDPVLGRRALVAAIDQLSELLLHLDASAARSWDEARPLVEQTAERVTAILVRSSTPWPELEQSLILLRYWLRGLDASRWSGWLSTYRINDRPPGAAFAATWATLRWRMQSTQPPACEEPPYDLQQ